MAALWAWLHAPLKEAVGTVAGMAGHLAQLEYGEGVRRANLMKRM